MQTPNQTLHRTRPALMVLGVCRSAMRAGPVSGVVSVYPMRWTEQVIAAHKNTAACATQEESAGLNPTGWARPRGAATNRWTTTSLPC
jgi:hypothetical protein